jgi:hypothetical protein
MPPRKLGKSEMISVRLDPVLRYATQLAAAAERHTIAGFVEWATRLAVQRIGVVQRGSWVNALQVAEEVWSEDEVERFFFLARGYPELLTFTEKQLWERVRRDGQFELDWLREHWEMLKREVEQQVIDR